MRISDWSSDVCSSDLRGMVRALLNRIFRRRAAQPDSADDAAVEALTTDLSLRLTDRARAELQADFEALPRLRPRDRLDRQSVEEGQSVSVRVDLGGRRIHKKQTTNNSRRNSLT